MLSPQNHFTVLQNGLVGRLFSDLPVAACACNSEQRLVWANTAFGALYGYALDEVIGLPTKLFRALKQPGDEAAKILHRVFNQRAHRSGTYLGKRKSGDVIRVGFLGLPLDHFASVPVCGMFAFIWPSTGAEDPLEAVLQHLVNGCVTLPSLELAPPPAGFAAPGKGARQSEVQRLLALGYSAKDVASIMQISVSTVHVVRWRLAQTERDGNRRTDRKRDR